MNDTAWAQQRAHPTKAYRLINQDQLSGRASVTKLEMSIQIATHKE